MKEVRVFAPATVANLGVGYDLLGLAVDKPGDEVTVRRSDRAGFRITNITGGALPTDPQLNTAGFGVLKMLEKLGEGGGIEMEIHKQMPFASGMGSSAASAAAGVYAVNLLLGEPFSKLELAPFAILGESVASGDMHGDNVLPSLMGGVVLIRDSKKPDFVQLPSPEGLIVMLIHPQLEILTKESRAILKEVVSLKNHIIQSGNLASLVTGFLTGDIDRIKMSLDDVIIEPQRAQLINGFYEMKEIALKSGAFNYTISGAGPSMFGFFDDQKKAEYAGNKISKFLHNKKIESSVYISGINKIGACPR